MNKILSISALLAGALAFTGCAGEEDDLFSQSAAERLNETQAKFSERLTASELGWAMEYYPTTENEAPKGMGYLLLCDFDPNSKVLVGMNNNVSGNVYLQDSSAWEVIADNGPVLSFNTYNKCIHAFSDPVGNASLGTETGKGFEGDYEFVMVDVPEGGDYIMLKGKKRATYVRMTRLDDANATFESYLKDVQTFQRSKFSSAYANPCIVTFGDSVMTMRNASSGIAGMYPYGGDPILSETFHPFLITKRGGKYYFRFRDALTSSDESKTAQEFVFDEANDKFVGVEDPSYTIEGENPDTFFVQSLAEGNGWRFRSSSAMSDDFKSILTALNQEAKANVGSRATYNYFTFSKLDDGKYALSVNFRPNRGNAYDMVFYFTFAKTEKGFSLAYESAKLSDDEEMLTTTPSLATLLNTLGGEYELSSSSTKFNLNNLKATAEGGKTITWSFTTL